MKRELYVLMGEEPNDWSELPALGPFASEEAARKAIRHHVNEGLEGSRVDIGVNENWNDPYALIEVVKRFEPQVTVTAKITLSIIN